LGPDGKVRYHGRIDDNPDVLAVVRHDLREALNDVLSGGEVRLASTKAIGCAVGKSNRDENGRPKLVQGIGSVEFPVTTRSPRAQQFFNQAINYWFGFNFPEAEASFREAARLDPRCAMAQWGIALSLGMNYNADFDPSRLSEAEAAAQKARQLADQATPKERALIAALAIRHAPGKDMMKQLRPYYEAMGRIYYEYPDDVNVAVLYAASAMDLNPWKLWSPSGEPAPGTIEVIAVLENAMRKDPNHIGVNHYYIHATEASPFPERALKCTGRLAAQAPNSGHLVHMPSHTYMRVGDYRASAAANVQAAKVDAAYFEAKGKPTNYGGYYIHNLDFIVASLLWEGRSKEAIEAARELSQVAAKWTPDFATLFCGGGSGIMTVYARFGMWDEILKAPAADESNPFSAIPWRYARGMALAARNDLAGAAKELAALEALIPAGKEAAKSVPIIGMPEGLAHAFDTARLHLAGKMAAARGDHREAERLYREAITHEDAIPYIEPPIWRHPVRESLGALLISQGNVEEAEKVFRQALEIHRRSGRALFGLAEALERQGKRDEAARVRREFNDAWARADVKLTLAAL
jgi:tetratricopeptide (TPR) repeat protein